jgi:hypothetical protein
MPEISRFLGQRMVAKVLNASGEENTAGNQETNGGREIVRESAASSNPRLGQSLASASGSGHALEAPQPFLSCCVYVHHSYDSKMRKDDPQNLENCRCFVRCFDVS